MAYTEIEVTNLIQEVEKAFNAHLAKAEAFVGSDAESLAVVDGSELAKAEDKADEKEDKAPAKEAEAPKSDEAPAAEEKEAPAADAQAPAADAPEAPAADAAPAAEGEAPAAPAAAQGDAHDYDDEDMSAMVQMYQGMSRGELKAHHDAIKQCLDAMGMQEAAPAAPAAPAEAPAAPEAPMAKSEDAAIDVSKFAEVTKEVEILKSEVSAKEAENKDLRKSLDTVTEILTKLVKKSAPAAKAVTKLEAVAKSEAATEEKVLSKQEITAILTKKTKEQSLAKSDRDAINAYYGSGQVSTTGISHLLK
jgi:hypothetical protein